jgi:hypothetical protein
MQQLKIKGYSVGYMVNFAQPPQETNKFKIPQIEIIKSLFLEGKTPEEIGRKLQVSGMSVHQRIKLLIKQHSLVPEIPLNQITTEFLNNLLPSPYKVTKVFGKGWVLSDRQVICLELGNYPYSVYKQVLNFTKNIKGD